MTQTVKQLQKKLTYEQRLKDISNEIHSAKDIDHVLIGIKDHILELFDTDRITIYALADSKRSEIYSKFKTGDGIKEIRLPLDKRSIAGYVGMSLRSINIPNVYDPSQLKSVDPELRFDSAWDAITGYTTKQVLAVPIVFEDQLMGVIQLINKKGADKFTKDDECSLHEIARVLGIAFYNQSKMKDRSTKFSHLILDNVISQHELDQAIALAREWNIDTETVLIDRYKVSKQAIRESLSRFYSCKVFVFGTCPIDPELTKSLSHEYLKRNLCVPIRRDNDKVIIAAHDPSDTNKLREIKLSLRSRHYELLVALKEDILKILEYMQHPESKPDIGSVREIVSQLDVKEGEEDEEKEETAPTELDSKIVHLANKVIDDAYTQGASDIHIEPYGRHMDTEIRFRIDGRCSRYLLIPRSHTRAFTSRLKIMSGLDIAERRKPQDGRIKFKTHSGQAIELRVATIPTVGQGEDVVMRILPVGGPPLLDNIGFSDDNLGRFKEIVKKPHGIILVVGPTGSGKTTTLHSVFRYINNPDKKIWTAEDPVEITQYGLRQVQVLPKIGLTFAAALRAFLRADPDIIMVGEMRDKETCAMGIEASLTGHLVLSTLHTNSAPETVIRLLEMGMDPYNFADALLGILAQRLVRRLCVKCREPYNPSQVELDELRRHYGDNLDQRINAAHQKFLLYRAKGCDACRNTGYKGRLGIHELLVASDNIKMLIHRKATAQEIREISVREGMTTLLQDGIEKVISGLTDFIEVRTACIK